MDEVEREFRRNLASSIGGRKEPAPAVDAVAYKAIGAAIEVHSLLGPGFLESAYEEALAIELDARGIRHVRQHLVMVEYKGCLIGEYRLDFLIEGTLVVELKAVSEITSVHRAQLRAYLAATGHELGLILNFNVSRLKDNGIRRVVRTAEL